MTAKNNKMPDTEPFPNGYDVEGGESSWVDEPKTYESSPVTPEEMMELNNNFYGDDIIGGLHNIEVPEEELKRQQEQQEYIRTFVDINDVEHTPCYRTDMVHLKITPEHLVVLKESLEALSVDMKNINYLSEEADLKSLFEQQLYIIELHNIIEKTLNEYVEHRPYSPFLSIWFKRISTRDFFKKRNN